MRRSPAPQNLKRKILKDALRKNETRDAAFRRIMGSLPTGMVSTYGTVAAAAGYPPIPSSSGTPAPQRSMAALNNSNALAPLVFPTPPISTDRWWSTYA
jgi:hypothetical protein